MVRSMVSALAEISAADGFAIAMFGVIALSLGTVAVLFVCMRRNAARRDPHVDALLEELEEDERKELPAGGEAGEECPREPWEREADWWKS